MLPQVTLSIERSFAHCQLKPIVSRISLATASPEDLQHLAATCEPASFGVQQQDVYDESYRKAGKLDKTDFATNLSPDALGIVDAIRTELLFETRSRVEPIRAELYKLNVYGMSCLG